MIQVYLNLNNKYAKIKRFDDVLRFYLVMTY